MRGIWQRTSGPESWDPLWTHLAKKKKKKRIKSFILKRWGADVRWHFPIKLFLTTKVWNWALPHCLGTSKNLTIWRLETSTLEKGTLIAQTLFKPVITIFWKEGWLGSQGDAQFSNNQKDFCCYTGIFIPYKNLKIRLAVPWKYINPVHTHDVRTYTVSNKM